MPTNALTSDLSCGVGQFLTASTFAGSVEIPASLTTCPRYVTSVWNKVHLAGLSLSPAFCSLCNTVSSRCRCVVTSFENTMMSSRYTSNVSHCSPRKMVSISLSNVEGADVNPKGKTFHCHSPLLVTNADLSLASSSIGICQYPLVISSVENHLLPPRASKLSSTLGRGYASLCVTEFSLR